jgi:hypothetical protein
VLQIGKAKDLSAPLRINLLEEPAAIIFELENGSSRFLRNAGSNLQDCKVVTAKKIVISV